MSLGGFLSDNVLCLLAYNDEFCKIIRNSIPLNLFSGPHRIIAARAYDYIDRYNTPPKDHLADILEEKLSDPAQGQIYQQIIIAIRDTAERINTQFVLSQIQTFVKRQSLRSVAVELTKALQRDTEEGLEEADRLINEVRHSQIKLFDPGTRLSDKKKALRFLDLENECFPTGIPELDKRGFGPTRKELINLVGNAKSGKSFWLAHLAKMSITHRLRVVHITLEMSEERCTQRYFQTLISIAKRPETSTSIKFEKDEYGKITDFKEIRINPKFTLNDPNIREHLEKYVEAHRLRWLDNIIIKEFPTGSLTIEGLEAYLDMLNTTEGFTPDLLVVDYPDLMDLGREEVRFALDRVYKRLRGIGVERNLAVAVVSQSNRESAKKKTVDGTGVAEAYSKIQHADITITLSSTVAEKRLGLARLTVVAGRNDEGNITLVISQHYRTGTFIIDSAVMTPDYWGHLPEETDE